MFAGPFCTVIIITIIQLMHCKCELNICYCPARVALLILRYMSRVIWQCFAIRRYKRPLQHTSVERDEYCREKSRQYCGEI